MTTHAGPVLIADIAPAIRPATTPTPDSGRTERAFAMMGGFERKGTWEVPARMTAVVIMGGFDHRRNTGRPGASHIVVTGLALMGGVGVTVKKQR